MTEGMNNPVSEKRTQTADTEMEAAVARVIERAKEVGRAEALAALQNGFTETQIRHMVDRFLMWRLPEHFSPDAGISFKKTYNENTQWPAKHEPVGTNLFSADQATSMVRHMLEGLPAAS